MWPECQGISVSAYGVWVLTAENGEPLVGFNYRVIGLCLYFGTVLWASGVNVPEQGSWETS